MARSKTAGPPAAPVVGVDALKHVDDRRKSMPSAEHQGLMADEARQRVQGRAAPRVQHPALRRVALAQGASRAAGV